VTAIFTGMRLSELRGLPWSDVDLDAGVIHMRQRADAWLKIGPSKSRAGKPDIPLPLVVNTLRVFPNGVGNVEQMSNVHEQTWYPLQKKCGLVVDTGEKDPEGGPILTHRYGFHMLRHSGVPIHSIPRLDAQAAADGHGAFINHDDLRPLRTHV
jgi:integrase